MREKKNVNALKDACVCGEPWQQSTECCCGSEMCESTSKEVSNMSQLQAQVTVASPVIGSMNANSIPSPKGQCVTSGKRGIVGVTSKDVIDDIMLDGRLVTSFFRYHAIEAQIPPENDTVVSYDVSYDELINRFFDAYRIGASRQYRRNGNTIYRSVNVPLLICGARFLRNHLEGTVLYDVTSCDPTELYNDWLKGYGKPIRRNPCDLYRQYVFYVLSALTSTEAREARDDVEVTHSVCGET